MKPFLFMLICLILIFSCEIDDNSIENELFYPMQIGNSWGYLRMHTFTNIIGDSLPIGVSERVDSALASVWISGNETLNDSLETFMVKGIITVGNIPKYNSVLESVFYYSQQDGGLYIQAYQNAGIAPELLPKKSQTYQIRFSGKIYNNIYEIIQYLDADSQLPLFKSADDSLIYENPAVCVLKYPLTVGSQWTYRSSPWRIDKVVEDQIPVTTAGKTYSCYQIKWLYDMNGDNTWDEDIYVIDYVSEQGLIQRERFMSRFVVTDMDGNILGSFDSYFNMVLQSYNLK